MATTTPNYGLRKPTNVGGVSNKGDPIDVVADISDSMDTLDSTIKAISDKQTVGGAVDDIDLAIATTGSATYVETFTGGDPCAFTFVAPQSGKVQVSNNSYVDNNAAAGRTWFSWIMRVGAVIGSGTIEFDAGNSHAIENFGVEDLAAGRCTLVAGLTPGATYNIRQKMRADTGTGESQNRYLAVFPTF